MIKKVLLIIFVSFLLILYFISEITKAKDYSWNLNFSGISKDPFGCFVLRNTLENDDSLHFLQTTNATFYKTLSEIKNKGTLSMITITDEFNPDSVNLSSVYSFVKKGNNLFVSAYSFDQRFKDSLKFDVKGLTLVSLKTSADTINLINARLRFPKFPIYRDMNPSEFSKIDTVHHVALGNNRAGKINYIRVPYGKGSFYIHCQPLAFTNYHILYSHNEYAYNALSYLKHTNIIWDDYYKPGAGKYTLENETPFRYFLGQDALRYALYLTLLLIGIYFFIESKRKQRFIPIITPLENSTVKFVATIARLYQGQPDYKKMAIKKFTYLKEMIYSRYLIRIDENNLNTVTRFSEKSGFSATKLKDLFILYRKIESSASIDADTLIAFSKQVDEIYELEK